MVTGCKPTSVRFVGSTESVGELISMYHMYCWCQNFWKAQSLMLQVSIQLCLRVWGRGGRTEARGSDN